MAKKAKKRLTIASVENIKKTPSQEIAELVFQVLALLKAAEIIARDNLIPFNFVYEPSNNGSDDFEVSDSWESSGC